MLIIGLTGGIGSGKTTVSDLFSDYGAPIIDTDIIARELIDSDPTVLQEITAAFGRNILSSDGCLDRKKLSKLVFKQQSKKQQLEEILHPRIRAEVEKKIHDYTSLNIPPPYIIVVIPLLLETGFKSMIDRVVTVISDKKIRVERVQQRDNRNREEIQSIINSQVSDKVRISAAADIIDNNNGINALDKKVQELHKKFSAQAVEQH